MTTFYAALYPVQYPRKIYRRGSLTCALLKDREGNEYTMHPDTFWRTFLKHQGGGGGRSNMKGKWTCEWKVTANASTRWPLVEPVKRVEPKPPL